MQQTIGVAQGNAGGAGVSMDSNDVMRVLYQRLGCQQQLLVPRVSWGLVNWGECDVLALSDRGYLTEYEIKISRADIRREWKKRRWTSHRMKQAWRQMVRRYYMAVPHDLMDSAVEFMPEDVGGGVIVVDYPHKWGRAGFAITQKAKTNTTARKLTDRERMQLGRLGTMRYWGEFMVRTSPLMKDAP